jgi:hypothetical protein
MNSLLARSSMCVAALALLIGNPTEAKGSFVVDQSQLSFDGFVNLRFSGASGQEFTPAHLSLDRVDLLFDGPGGSFPADVTGDFSVSIRQDSIAGPLVGESSPVTLLSGIFREVVLFDFPRSVPLLPGDRYVIGINRLSDPFLPFFVGVTGSGVTPADFYPGGRAILNGDPQMNVDLYFREGSSTLLVSEPATLVLCGLGILGLVGLHWQRRKGPSLATSSRGDTSQDRRTRQPQHVAHSVIRRGHPASACSHPRGETHRAPPLPNRPARRQ